MFRKVPYMVKYHMKYIKIPFKSALTSISRPANRAILDVVLKNGGIES